ncbi:nucleotidyltransferase family protein [Roseovarius salinarum]|uniref:nucleotidyltransferase family protein n=1 Tax=Roseovarius salinarum TaxID=1981892 RepID=UPI000C33C604|nr:nucleotidyltransferase family protein [Roseovarius salinarum]
MRDILILIPAAGAATRMRGRDKLLEPVAGAPLLARQAKIALATGARVLVTLPPDAPARRATLDRIADARLCPETVADPAEGIAASLRAGARRAQDTRAAGLMVLLADLPELEPSDLEAVFAGFADAPDRPARAVDDSGTPGHPVVFPPRLYRDLLDLAGDTGARAILKDSQVTRVQLAGARATTDLDTPEAWAAWRARNAR